MITARLALVTLAGLGLVTSELAAADTMPGAALPSIGHARPAKLARLTDKRQGVASADAFPLGAVFIVAGGAAAVGYSLYEVLDNGTSVYVPVSKGN